MGANSSSPVTVQLYSPRRPVVDVAEVFLWLMAVGTILCASYWSAWTAREVAIEQDKLLKVIYCISKANFYFYFVFEDSCCIVHNSCKMSNYLF